MKSLTIAIDLSVKDDTDPGEAADNFIDWLLDITDGIDAPEWLVSFDGAEARRF